MPKILINSILLLICANNIYAQTGKDLSPDDFLLQNIPLINKNVSGDNFNDSTNVKHFHLLIVVVDSNIYHVTKENVDSMVAGANRYFESWKFEFCYSVEFIDSSQLTIAQSVGDPGTYPKHRFDMLNVVINEWPTLGYSGNPIKIDYSVVINNSFWGGIVLAHELGHDLMLSHVTDSTNIMYPSSYGMVLPVSFDSSQAYIMHYYTDSCFIWPYSYSFNSYATLLSFGEEVCADVQEVPYARFYSDIHGGCNPLTVQFFDNSSFNRIAWLWNFGDGTTSGQQNPTHTYAQAGEYDVSLSVFNLFGDRTVVKNRYIVVNEDAISLPVTESFESTVFPPQKWYIENTVEYFTWGRDTSLFCAYADDFYNNTVRSTSNSLITPFYKFNYTTNPEIIFDYAYNWYAFATPDSLNIYYSTNCSATYHSIFSIGGVQMITSSDSLPYYTKFVPNSANDWKTDTIDLGFLAGSPDGVSFRFEFVHGSKGNFLYLDNIRIEDKCDATVANYTVNNDTINLYTDDTAVFLNQSSNATIWHWSFGDGEESTEENPVHVYDSTGTYIVTLVAANVECSDTVTGNIVVIYDNSINSRTKSNNNMQIFPNPATSHINVNFRTDSEDNIKIVLYDLYNRQVAELFNNRGEPQQEYSLNYDAKGLQSGVYYVVFEAGVYKTIRKIIIVK